MAQYNTRFAEIDDLPIVCPMYFDALEELGEKYDPDDAMEHILACWSKAPCILLVDDDIIGFAGLTTFSPCYDKKRAYLREYMFYVRPDKRGIRAWRTLTKAVQSVSDKFNIEFIGEHRLQGDISAHLRLIKMAGAKPIAITSTYGGHNGR